MVISSLIVLEHNCSRIYVVPENTLFPFYQRQNIQLEKTPPHLQPLDLYICNYTDKNYFITLFSKTHIFNMMMEDKQTRRHINTAK